MENFFDLGSIVWEKYGTSKKLALKVSYAADGEICIGYKGYFIDEFREVMKKHDFKETDYLETHRNVWSTFDLGDGAELQTDIEHFDGVYTYFHFYKFDKADPNKILEIIEIIINEVINLPKVA